MNESDARLLAWTEVVGCVVLTIAPVGGPLIAQMPGSDLAAWVQAIGSVAAIWAGFHLAQRETREARLADAARSREAHIMARRIALTLAGNAKARLETTCEVLRRGGGFTSSDIGLFKRSIENDLRVAESFDVTRLTNLRLIQLSLIFPGVLGSAVDRCREAAAHMATPGTDAALIVQGLTRDLGRLEETAGTRLMEMQEELGFVLPEEIV